MTRKPRAPESSAASTALSSRSAESTMTAVPGCRFRIAAQTSAPEPSGSLESSSTTSGRCSTAVATASVPLSASATTLAPLATSSAQIPRRTIRFGSTTRTRVAIPVMVDPPHRGMEDPPPGVYRRTGGKAIVKRMGRGGVASRYWRASCSLERACTPANAAAAGEDPGSAAQTSSNGATATAQNVSNTSQTSTETQTGTDAGQSQTVTQSCTDRADGQRGLGLPAEFAQRFDRRLLRPGQSRRGLEHGRQHQQHDPAERPDPAGERAAVGGRPVAVDPAERADRAELRTRAQTRRRSHRRTSTW